MHLSSSFHIIKDYAQQMMIPESNTTGVANTSASISITTPASIPAQGWQCPACKTIYSPTTSSCGCQRGTYVPPPYTPYPYTIPYTAPFTITSNGTTTQLLNEQGTKANE